MFFIVDVSPGGIQSFVIVMSWSMAQCLQTSIILTHYTIVSSKYFVWNSQLFDAAGYCYGKLLVIPTFACPFKG